MTSSHHQTQTNQATSELDTLISSLDEGYYELDQNFCYCRINDTAARMARKSPSELLGKSVLDLFPEVADQAIHRAVRQVMATRQPATLTYYFDPFHRWYLCAIYPSQRGVAIFSRDINDQKTLEYNLSFLAQASKVLSSSLDYQKTLKNVAKLAVPQIADWCSIDILTQPNHVELLALAHIDPKKVRWARQLRRTYPVDLKTSTGVPQVLRTGKPEFHPHITDDIIKASVRTKRELKLIQQIGLSALMIVPLRAHRKTIGAITFVASDPTRHYTQADLNTAEELASRASLAIENANLYGQAQQAIRLRDDFISIASHELKTPVTSLKVYTEVLQRQQKNQPTQSNLSRHLEKMNQQIDKLSQLISDLLNISRLQTGKLEFRQGVYDLNELVHETVETIQQSTPTHTIEISGQIRQPVYIDKDRIGQVLANLLTNAIKYSPDASRVIVRLQNRPDSVMISVQDFGIGIDKQHLDKLFDRFYRVNNPEEKTFPGLGIGLYISRIIIERHHGRIMVDSTKGQGSTFSFILPNQSP